MDEIRFELGDTGQLTAMSSDKLRRNARVSGALGGSLGLLVLVSAVVATVRTSWSAEIIVGVVLLAGLATVLLVNARHRSAWAREHTEAVSVRLGPDHAFTLRQNTVVFPAQPGRPEEIWPLATISVSMRKFGSQQWLVLRSPRRRTRRYPQFVLADDVSQIARLLSQATSVAN